MEVIKNVEASDRKKADVTKETRQYQWFELKIFKTNKKPGGKNNMSENQDYNI